MGSSDIYFIIMNFATLLKDKNKLLGWILFFIIALAFYSHNYLSAEYLDDFVYKFVFVNGAPDFSQPICSIQDIILSQYDHYFTWNGRSIVHLFVQFFSGLLGKNTFNIFNTIVFCIFILLLRSIVSKQNRSDFFIFATIISLVFLMPSFANTFIWMTGSINYLWSATCLLLFLHIYESRQFDPLHKKTISLLVLSILLGWTHEAISFPLAISIVAFNFLYPKQNIKTTGFWLAIFFLAGACLSAFAPATIARSGATKTLSVTDIALKVFSGFVVMSKLRIIYISIIAIIIIWSKDRNLFKAIISNNRHLLLATIPALAIVFISGFDASRVAFGLELYCLIILLRIISQAVNKFNAHHLNLVSCTLSFGICVFYCFVFYHAIPTWHETQNLISQIQNNKDGVIGTNEHDSGFFSPFICTMIEKDNSDNAMNYDAKGWPASIAATYHRDSLVFFPQSFLTELKLNPNKFSEFDMDSPYEFFIKRIANEQIDSVKWQLRPTDFSKIPFFFRPIAKKLGRYIDNIRNCEKWMTLYLNDQRFLIIKKAHSWDDRLIGIQIKAKNRLDVVKTNKAA